MSGVNFDVNVDLSSDEARNLDEWAEKCGKRPAEMVNDILDTTLAARRFIWDLDKLVREGLDSSVAAEQVTNFLFKELDKRGLRAGFPGAAP